MSARVHVEPGLPVPWVCWQCDGEHGVIVRPDTPPDVVAALADRWPTAGQEATR